MCMYACIVSCGWLTEYRIWISYVRGVLQFIDCFSRGSGSHYFK